MKLIKNVKLLNEENVDVLIDKNKIIDISKDINVKIDNVIDAGGMYVLSGQVNAYFDGTLKDASRLLSQGVTAVYDFANDEKVTKYLVDSGIKVYKAIGDFNGQTLIDENFINTEVKKWLSVGVKNIILYALSPNMSEESTYEILLNYASKKGYLLATHASENLEDVGEIDKVYGLSPIGLLESYGFFDFKNMIIDCVYVDKDDVELLKNYDTTICSCSTKNLRSGNGIAPTYSFIKNNINVVLGGVSSNHFKELSLLSDLQSGTLNEKGIISDSQILNINSNNFHLFNDIGCLEVGGYADIVIVDENDILNLTPLNVKMVFIDGECRYKI